MPAAPIPASLPLPAGSTGWVTVAAPGLPWTGMLHTPAGWVGEGGLNASAVLFAPLAWL